VAAKLRSETQLESLQVGLESKERLGTCDPGYTCAYQSTISWRTPTTPLFNENLPRAIFERLFGDGGTTEPSARLAQLERRRSLLDSMTNKVARLSKTLGPNDRAKLTEYLEAVRDVERRIQLAESQNSVDLPVVEQPQAGVPATFEEHLMLMADL